MGLLQEVKGEGPASTGGERRGAKEAVEAEGLGREKWLGRLSAPAAKSAFKSQLGSIFKLVASSIRFNLKLVLKQSLHMQLYLSLVQQDACAEADIPAGL